MYPACEKSKIRLPLPHVWYASLPVLSKKTHCDGAAIASELCTRTTSALDNQTILFRLNAHVPCIADADLGARLPVTSGTIAPSATRITHGSGTASMPANEPVPFAVS